MRGDVLILSRIEARRLWMACDRYKDCPGLHRRLARWLDSRASHEPNARFVYQAGSNTRAAFLRTRLDWALGLWGRS